MSKFSKSFLKEAIHFIELNPPRIKNCLDRLSEEQVWQKPNAVSNSIANLILHLCGNITQYVISSLGHTPDIRQRDLEFSTSTGYSKADLLDRIEQVTKAAIEVLKHTRKKELYRIRNVQGFEMTGIAIVIHVTEHYSYHVGQIALLTKILVEQELGFYADSDLSIKNKD